MPASRRPRGSTAEVPAPPAKRARMTRSQTSPIRTPSHCYLFQCSDDLLLKVIGSLSSETKKNLRLVNKQLRHLTSHSIHHITFNRHQHTELTGPDRRRALCLQMTNRFPAITSCTIDHIFSGPVSLVPKLLRQLPLLRKLDLFSARPSPQIIKQLSACSQLRELRLDHSLAASLKTLPHLPNLQQLEIILRVTSVTPTFLQPLGQYAHLHTLILQPSGCLIPIPNTAESTIHLDSLSLLRHLRTLSLHWPIGRLNTSFVPLPNLTSLNLTVHNISTPTIDSLLALTSLHTLQLSLDHFSSAHDPPAWQSNPYPPVFPHLTQLTLPMKLLAAPGCPKLPSLKTLTTSTSRVDSDDHTPGLSRLPLPTLSSFTFSMDIGDVKIMKNVLHALVQGCRNLQNLDLHGPLPQDAPTMLANLKTLRTVKIVTRVLAALERDELISKLNWLERQLPLIEKLNSTVNMPPTFVWFWNVMQLI